MKVKIADLYDLSHTIAAPLLERFEYPWEALAHIKEFILELGPTLPADEFDNPRKGCGSPRTPRYSRAPTSAAR